MSDDAINGKIERLDERIDENKENFEKQVEDLKTDIKEVKELAMDILKSLNGNGHKGLKQKIAEVGTHVAIQYAFLAALVLYQFRGLIIN